MWTLQFYRHLCRKTLDNMLRKDFMLAYIKQIIPIKHRVIKACFMNDFGPKTLISCKKGMLIVQIFLIVFVIWKHFMG